MRFVNLKHQKGQARGFQTPIRPLSRAAVPLGAPPFRTYSRCKKSQARASAVADGVVELRSGNEVDWEATEMDPAPEATSSNTPALAEVILLQGKLFEDSRVWSPRLMMLADVDEAAQYERKCFSLDVKGLAFDCLQVSGGPAATPADGGTSSSRTYPRLR
jgi:hypothetical protein